MGSLRSCSRSPTELAAQSPTDGGLSGPETATHPGLSQICWVLWTEPAPIPSRSGPANPSKKGCNWAGPTVPGISAFEGSAFVFGKSAPDPGVLAGLD